MSTDQRSKAATEALHRVRAARQALDDIRSGVYSSDEMADEALRLAFMLLDQAATLLENEK